MAWSTNLDDARKRYRTGYSAGVVARKMVEAGSSWAEAHAQSGIDNVSADHWHSGYNDACRGNPVRKEYLYPGEK